jgi:hypothetical protein
MGFMETLDEEGRQAWECASTQAGSAWLSKIEGNVIEVE